MEVIFQTISVDKSSLHRYGLILRYFADVIVFFCRYMLVLQSMEPTVKIFEIVKRVYEVGM